MSENIDEPKSNSDHDVNYSSNLPSLYLDDGIRSSD